MYTTVKHRGFVVIGYFDLRAATLAQHTLQGHQLGGSGLAPTFLLPQDGTEAAAGQLLVISLDGTTTKGDLLYLFSQYGEVKGIKDDAQRPTCSLVEFFDVRHAGGGGGEGKGGWGLQA